MEDEYYKIIEKIYNEGNHEHYLTQNDYNDCDWSNDDLINMMILDKYIDKVDEGRKIIILPNGMELYFTKKGTFTLENRKNKRKNKLKNIRKMIMNLGFIILATRDWPKKLGFISYILIVILFFGLSILLDFSTDDIKTIYKK
jgi:hypothetical protein